jgi:probable HAF family extracellular repeat protein
MKLLCGVALSILYFLGSLGNAHAAITYNLTVITASGDPGPSINDSGQIAIGDRIRSASGTWTTLQVDGGTEENPGVAAAWAINNLGQVGGMSSLGYQMPSAWQSNGTPISLGEPISVRGDAAITDINSTGQMVGFAIDHEHSTSLFYGLSIGSFSAYYSTPYGLNDLGVAVGIAVTHDIPASQAVMWTTAGMTLLDTRVITDENNEIVDYGHSTAYDINNLGQIIGWAEYEDGVRATLWENGTMYDLGALESNTASSAFAINEAGIAVGESSGRAVSFKDGQVLDLNMLVDPAALGDWTLISATDINEQGWIVGTMSNGNIFLLKPISPVPEPATWLMLMIGVFIAAQGKRITSA